MSHPVIERAVPGDAEAIATLQRESLRASHEELLPGAARELVLGSERAQPRSTGWSGWLRRSEAITVVARDEGNIVGFCALHPVLGGASGSLIAEIAAFFVSPTRWRRGVGVALWRGTLREAEAKGLREFVLWVLEENTRARRFYEALGFRADGGSRVFLEHRDIVLYELRYRRLSGEISVLDQGHTRH